MTRRGGVRWIAVALAGTALIAFVAARPTTTRVGVDFVVTTYEVPLWEKAIAFVHRDAEMRRIARLAADGAADEADRAERLLRWTHEHVRPLPIGFPVVDDHVHSVIVRGYGNADQAADVFATLAAYQGIPATLVFARRLDGTVVHAVAYAKISGMWQAVDVRGGFIIRDPSGRPITVDDLRRNPRSAHGLPVPAGSGGLTYPEIAALLPPVPERLRPRDQMPLERLWQEIAARFRS